MHLRHLSLALALSLILVPSVAAGATDRAIEKQVVVGASRAEVWRAWTTAEGITTFFGAGANIELRHRGPYEIYFDLEQPEGSRGSEGCEVLGWIDEEMLCFTWNAPPSFPDVRRQRSFVVLRFDDAPGAPGSATRVTLTHGGWGAGKQWDEVHAYFDAAWDRVLAALVERFDGRAVPEGKAVTPDPWRHYTYFIRPADETFLTRTEFSESELTAMNGHVEHIKRLMAEDRLICAGPCVDPTYFPEDDGTMRPLGIPSVGIVVFRAHSDEEARAVMQADPAVAAGVFKAQVNPMHLSFIRP